MRRMTRALARAAALIGAVLLVTAPGRAEAQNAVIAGKVTTDFGKALEGANVYINDLSVSVGTNAEGDYTLTIPAARVQGQQVNLRVRSFGFQPQVRPVRVTPGRQVVNFALKQDVNRLAEIVVTGVTAGTEQKKLPFTVARVDERLMPVPSANPLTQLQGKVAGVSIMSTSGRPGATQSVLLRGPQSINASGRSQGPLYILDGIVLEGGLPDINPLDIESVEVVKGAAASSLYGSRAGSGVIQITTKSGRNSSDGVRFNARSEFGMGDIESEYEYSRAHTLQMDETRTKYCRGATNCTIVVDFEEEALRVNQNGGDFALGPTTFERDHAIGAAPSRARLHGLFQSERWVKSYNPIAAVMTPGQNWNNSLDAQGRFRGTMFFASLNNFEQAGAFKYLKGFNRNSMRLNLDQELGEAFTFGLRSYYSTATSHNTNQEDGGTGFFRLTRQPAGVDLTRRDNEGRLFIRSNPLNQGGQNQNPLYLFEAEVSERARERFLSNFNTSYSPFEWLQVESDLSFDRTTDRYLRQNPKGFRTTSSSPTTNAGFLQRDAGVNSSYNASVDVHANRTFLGDLLVRGTGRYIYEQQDGEDTGGSGNTLATGGITTLDAVANQQSIDIYSSVSSIRSIGMMAGVDAEYKERYIVGVLARRDGSSLFGENNRWANYGRASLAWRMAAEPWWFAPSAVNELKLRGSIGTAGGRPRFSAQYETFTIGANGALSKNTVGNKDLRPETVTETELGLDAELLSRIGLTLNYAVSTAKDQILPVPASLSSGFLNQWKNAGTMENKTWEASLNIPIIQKQNINWSIRGNFDHNVATITELGVPEWFGGPSQQGATSMFKYAAGERYGTFYGRRFVTSCAELDEPFRSQCGGAGAQFQKNDHGLIVWTGGKSLSEGITHNYWAAELPACTQGTAIVNTVGITNCTNAGGTVTAPWARTVSWGIPIVIRDSAGTARQLKLGNALPDYRVGLANTMNYKKFFLYAALDGVFGRDVFNEGRHWSLGDFMTKETDQLDKSVYDAKPVGYYYRSADDSRGLGGLYDVLGPNSFTTEDASFIKLRELNLSYQVGPLRGVGDWTVMMIGRNLVTFTKYHGFDPEVGYGGGESNSSQINALDAYTFPNLRTFTFAVQTKF